MSCIITNTLMALFYTLGKSEGVESFKHVRSYGIIQFIFLLYQLNCPTSYISRKKTADFQKYTHKFKSIYILHKNIFIHPLLQ